MSRIIQGVYYIFEHIFIARYVITMASNQVYRNLDNSRSYNGDIFGKQYNMHGLVPTNIGFLSVELSRVDDKHAMFAVVGAQAGVVWGAGTRSLTADPGTLPLEFRPRVTQYNSIFFLSPSYSSKIKTARLTLQDNGGWQIIYATAVGDAQDFATGDQVLPTAIVYPILP